MINSRIVRIAACEALGLQLLGDLPKLAPQPNVASWIGHAFSIATRVERLGCSHTEPARRAVVKRRYHVIVKAAVLFFLLCLPAVADLATGLDALKNGDYAAALSNTLF